MCLPSMAPRSGPRRQLAGAVSTRTDQDIADFIGEVNKTYFPYGIRIVLDAAVDRAGVLNLAHQGAVDDVTEFDTTTALNRAAHSINAYFVPTIVELTDPANLVNPGTIGESVSNLVTNRGHFGLLIADFVTDAANNNTPADAHAVAHEVGHVVNLINDPSGQFVHVNRRVDPGTGQEHNVRDDIVATPPALRVYGFRRSQCGTTRIATTWASAVMWWEIC